MAFEGFDVEAQPERRADLEAFGVMRVPATIVGARVQKPGPSEFGMTPGDVGINFRVEGILGALDVSGNGNCVFGAWVPVYTFSHTVS